MQIDENVFRISTITTFANKSRIKSFKIVTLVIQIAIESGSRQPNANLVDMHISRAWWYIFILERMQ